MESFEFIVPQQKIAKGIIFKCEIKDNFVEVKSPDKRFFRVSIFSIDEMISFLRYGQWEKI